MFGVHLINSKSRDKDVSKFLSNMTVTAEEIRELAESRNPKTAVTPEALRQIAEKRKQAQ